VLLHEQEIKLLKAEHEAKTKLAEATYRKEISVCVSSWRRQKREVEIELASANQALAATQIELASANEALAATKEELREAQDRPVLKLLDGVCFAASKGFHHFNVFELEKFVEDLKADGKKLYKLVADHDADGERLDKFAVDLKAVELSLNNWMQARANVEDKVPAFICLVTQRLMDDPVMTVDGRSFEREDIKGYLAKLKENGEAFKSPYRNPLSSDKLTENANLKKAIATCVEHEWRNLNSSRVGESSSLR
jgi:hypothetical protein